jgi:translation initiation factor 2-alpha kinase 4
MNDVAKEEIEAIKAIFGQDYSNRTNQIDIPWKDPIKEIIHMIRIQAFENQEVLVDFEFVYTPNYPFECPILQVSNPQGLGGNLVKLQSELKQHSFQYLGQEMIFELASLVKEFIEDHNEFNDLKTSGFISMKNNLKAEAVKLNKQDEKEAKEKKLLKQQENEELQEAIQKELDMKKLLLLSQHKQSTNDIYLNDSLDEEDSNDFQYTDNNALTSNICNSDTPLIKNAIVSPCRIGQNPYHTLCWFNYSSELFMIETFEIQSPTTSLESKMQNFLSLNHPNTPKIYDYTILTTENSTILKILVSAVKIGVLDILKVSGTIPLKSAANILFGMISLMQYYQSENIEISALTLNDIYYDNQMNVQFMGSFLFPDFHLKPEKSPFNGFTLPNLEDECLKQEKQLFDVGSLLLILLNGEEIYKFKDPISCAENTQYSNSNLLSIVKMLMDTNISINTTLESLLEHPFLTMEQEASMRVRKDYSGEYDHPREINVSRYVNDFDEVEFLGQGGFGAVVKAKNVIDGRFYAIKKIKLNPKDTKRLLREVQTISRVHSEYVVRYYQAWFEDSDGLNTPSEDSESDYSDYTSDESSDWLSSGVSLDLHKSSSVKILRRISTGVSKSPIRGSFTKILYIQMEYCKNNTLRDVIDLGISHEDAWKHFRQLLEGLGHLHSQGIIHRDLKPSNVFLDESGTVKIGDFGLATVKGNLIHQEPIDLIKSTADMTSEVGTPVYTAPEILISTGRYNSKVDMYSLGILFFEVF